MGIRDTVNNHPKSAFVVSAALIVLMVYLAVFRIIGGGGPTIQNSDGLKSWCTVDDGLHWFADEAGKLVPFQHEGKAAYRCYLWSCDGGNTKFVSHLERVKADTLALLTRAGKTKVDLLEMPPGSLQVKRPQTGDAQWIDISDPRATEITTPRCSGKESGSTPKWVEAQ